MFIRALVTINLISFLFGNPIHVPTEISTEHGIYATTMYIYDLEVYDMDTTTMDDDSGLITLVDGNENLWEYEEYPEDYYVGDYVAVMLDDNGTPETIYDDIIIDIRATGFCR